MSSKYVMLQHETIFHSFLMLNSILFCIYATFFFLIHSPISENLGNFYFLPIADNADLNMAMKISFPSSTSSSSAYIPRCGIA